MQHAADSDSLNHAGTGRGLDANGVAGVRHIGGAHCRLIVEAAYVARQLCVILLTAGRCQQLVVGMMGGKDAAQILQTVRIATKAAQRARLAFAAGLWRLQLCDNQAPVGLRPACRHRKGQRDLIDASGHIERQIQMLAGIHAAQLKAACLKVVLAFNQTLICGTNRWLLQLELLEIDAQLLHVRAVCLDCVLAHGAHKCGRVADDGALQTRRRATGHVGYGRQGEGDREGKSVSGCATHTLRSLTLAADAIGAAITVHCATLPHALEAR